MKLIFIRHAEPDYEKDSLTGKGFREAALLSKRVAAWKVTDFYCSPLGRAQATAEPCLKLLNRQAETLPWLHEFDLVRVKNPYATYADIAWDLLPDYLNGHPELFDPQDWKKCPLFDGTDFVPYYDRTAEAADRLLARYGYIRDGLSYRLEADADRDAVCVLFCHLGVTCAVLSHLINAAPHLLWQGFFLPPSSVTVAGTEERDGEHAYFRVETMGDVSHLRNAGEPVSCSGSFANVFQD